MSESTTDTDAATGTDSGSDTETTADAGPDGDATTGDADAAIDGDVATEDADAATDGGVGTPADSALRRNLYRAGLGLFGLLAVVAVLQLYGSVNATINTFVAREYRSLFRAAFNLVVLLMSGAGISWCVRELSRERAP